MTDTDKAREAAEAHAKSRYYDAENVPADILAMDIQCGIEDFFVGDQNGYERAMREVLDWLDSQKLGNGETKVAVTTREMKAFIQEKLK